MKREPIDPSAVLAGMRDLVVVVDDRLILMWCNPAMTTMLGWKPEQVVGRPVFDLVHPDDVALAVAGIDTLHSGEEVYRVGVRILSGAGDWMPVSITGLDHTDDPRIGGLVLTVRSAEQHTRDLGELQRQSFLDRLTGLPSRQNLQGRLEVSSFQEQPSINPNACVSACVVDIDLFKRFNDIHGYRVGDAILAVAADRLKDHLKPYDVLARHGGDQFVLVLTENDRAVSAVAIAESLRASLALPFEIGENVLHLTASVGIATHPYDDLDSDRLLQEANMALYAAKEQGRDRVVEFSQDLAIQVRRKRQQRAMVRDALDHGGLVVEYQPIVDTNLRVVAVESLVRCLDHTGSVLGPDEFLASIAGRTIAVQLDHHVFAASCVGARRLQRNRPDAPLWVSCNIAPNTLAQADFADRILATVDNAGVDPSLICLEITETAAFEAGPSSLDALERLHRAGLQIALDDFGTGFSSLSHLLELPLSKVKIDRSFIASVHEDGPEHAITRGATDLAQSLHCEVVAEGVETEAQMQALQRLGVDLLQGWFFARSMPLRQLIELLEGTR